MHIYENEIKDNLEELIKKNQSVAFSCLAEVDKTDNIDEKALAGYIEGGRNYDLYHFKSILASVGVNKNDDYFLAKELWDAKNTPVNKPVNHGHNEKDIIGVILNSTAIDKDGIELKEYSDSINDIVTHAVLWAYWEDENLKDKFFKTISKIESNELFVSMECLFKKFDYALADQNGNVRIIERNKETSFLTKYLKIFGGEGVYNNDRIYRVLREFTFSGKGIVSKPANERSIISDNLLASAAECNCESEDCEDDYEVMDFDCEDGEDDYSAFAAENSKDEKRLNKPFRTPNGPKKFSVYVKNDKGNVVKVNFGDPNMSIKRDDPERRKSFRARHNCDNPGPKWKARYWSCKFWSTPSVTKLLAENIMENEKIVELQTELDSVKAELENYKKVEAEKRAQEIELLQRQIAELTDVAKAAKDALSAKEIELSESKASYEAKLDEAKASINTLQADKKNAERMNLLVSANVDSTKAEDILKTWASLSDEQFASIVNLYSTNNSDNTDRSTASFNLDSADGTNVNLNGDSEVDKAVAKQKALAKAISDKFNFKLKKGE